MFIYDIFTESNHMYFYLVVNFSFDYANTTIKNFPLKYDYLIDYKVPPSLGLTSPILTKTKVFIKAGLKLSFRVKNF